MNRKSARPFYTLQSNTHSLVSAQVFGIIRYLFKLARFDLQLLTPNLIFACMCLFTLENPK